MRVSNIAIALVFMVNFAYIQAEQLPASIEQLLRAALLSNKKFKTLSAFFDEHKNTLAHFVNSEGYGVLHQALEVGNIRTVNKLLEYSAIDLLSTQHPEKLSPLFVILVKYKKLQKTADTLILFLLECAQNKQILAEVLTQRLQLTNSSQARFTPLLYVVKNYSLFPDHLKLIQLFLRFTTPEILNTNLRYNNSAGTVLHHAAYVRNRPIYNLLVAHGASPSIKGRSGKTPAETIDIPISGFKKIAKKSKRTLITLNKQLLFKYLLEELTELIATQELNTLAFAALGDSPELPLISS